MVVTFFAKQSDFRRWLIKNHKKEKELIVGFYRRDSGKPSITWSHSVDEALCFGWIDAIRKSIDKDSYQIRFTPRKLTSIWSAVNIKKVAELTEKGLMQPAGIAIFEKRVENKSTIYAFENEEVKFSPAFEKNLKPIKKHGNIFNPLLYLIESLRSIG
jgi:uncharacterized protein YdeI (YjbR/CyaY-like superfamily)